MIPFIILMVSAVVHYIYFGYPASVVFDEVHAGNFITNYWHGTYFFDVHPPLGKLLEVLLGYMTGANNASVDFGSIGNPLPWSVILLRLIPTLAGTILPLLVYAILRKLDVSRSVALVAALLVTFENSLVVQSRFILFDVVMIAFGLTAILCYLYYQDPPRRLRKLWPAFLTASLLCAAAAPSIKWTGLAFVLIIFLLEIYRHSAKNGSIFISMRKSLGTSSIYLATILIVYAGLFAVHFALLPHSGPGDDFMSKGFLKTLSGIPQTDTTTVAPENFGQKFIELNIAMFRADETLMTPHEYSSHWYTWPLEIRPIYYWVGDTESSTTKSYIYLLGNPLIYWLGSISILVLTIYGLSLMFGHQTSSLSPVNRRVIFFVVVGFLANFLPFIFIGRVMFLYHYGAALVWSIMAIAVSIDLLHSKTKTAALITVTVVAIMTFIFFAPLTYGTPLSDAGLDARMWLSTWR